MPLYDYRCHLCNKTFEVRQHFADPLLTVHESCGGELERLISVPTLQFKGTGWYVTDYGKNGKLPSKTGWDAKSDGKSESGSESKSEGKSNSEGKGEGKTEHKSESRSDHKSEGKGEGKSEGKSESKSESKGESKSESKPAPAATSSEK